MASWSSSPHINIYPLTDEHGEAVLVLNKRGAAALMGALMDAQGHMGEYAPRRIFASDGEAYDLQVKVSDDPDDFPIALYWTERGY